MNSTTCTTSFRTAGSLAAVLLTAGALSACVAPGGDDSATPPASTPSAEAAPSATPTPTRDPLADAEEAQLPLPADEIADWAREAVPAPGSPGHESTSSGWMSEHSARQLTSTNTTLEAGDYQLQLACRGEGTITATVTALDGASAGEGTVCSNATIAFDATITEQGLVTTLVHEGAPTIYALSVLRVE